MFLREQFGVQAESHPVYRQLALENLARQYEFLHSITKASLQLNQPFLSIEVIRALNFHATACLHANAGEFRTVQVSVRNPENPSEPPSFQPPPHFEVNALMQLFTNQVNRIWSETDPFHLSALVLWRLNHIHPFINGNGRTARVVSYFVLCLKLDNWLPGSPILPELIRLNRDEYIQLLREVDSSAISGSLYVSPLAHFIQRLLEEQLGQKNPQPPNLMLPAT